MQAAAAQLFRWFIVNSPFSVFPGVTMPTGSPVELTSLVHVVQKQRVSAEALPEFEKSALTRSNREFHLYLALLIGFDFSDNGRGHMLSGRGRGNSVDVIAVHKRAGGFGCLG